MNFSLLTSPSILALDTCAEFCSVALLHPGQLSVLEAPGGAAASRHLLPLVQQILSQAQLNLRDLQALALINGPGSFTGVRTTVSVVQGLAIGAALPVISVTSLEALALSQRSLGRVASIIDARMQEVYFAVYDIGADNSINTLIAPRVASFFEAQQTCHALGLTITEVQTLPALAGVAAQQAAYLWQRGQYLNAAQIQPFYVRNKVALTSAERAMALPTVAKT